MPDGTSLDSNTLVSANGSSGEATSGATTDCSVFGSSAVLFAMVDSAPVGALASPPSGWDTAPPQLAGRLPKRMTRKWAVFVKYPLVGTFEDHDDSCAVHGMW